MLNNLLIVSGQVATLFMLMGAGFLLFKLDRLSEKTTSQMTFVLLYAVTPCLILSSLQIERDMRTLSNMGIAALCSALYFAVSIALSFLFYRNTAPDTRCVLRFSIIYTNSGFMGFPLVRAVLGQEAMIYAAVFLVTFNLLQWTHGVILMGGRQNASLKHVLLNPCTIALFLGITLFLLDFRLPAPVLNAAEHMSNLNTPLAMLIIGSQMAGADILKTFRTVSLYFTSLIRLIAFPALTALMLYPLGLPALMYSTIVILSAAPSAGMTSIFAQRFERDVLTAARAVTLTTLLSVLTLPVFAVIVRVLTE